MLVQEVIKEFAFVAFSAELEKDKYKHMLSTKKDSINQQHQTVIKKRQIAVLSPVRKHKQCACRTT